jgi:serine/threonine protein kinase
MLESTLGINRDIHSWEPLERIGEGGQSDVYLVRSPARQVEKKLSIIGIRQALENGDATKLATNVQSLSRPDTNDELGALKVFKFLPKSAGLPPPPPPNLPLERLKNEIAALNMDLAGLPKLLDSDTDEGWIVTEYFPDKSLRHNLLKYRGDVIGVLRAFRPLVQTVAALHAKHCVHRDIKPHNVFLRNDKLVLGDFGIVFMPNDDGRLTLPLQRVGSRDYMPPWTNLGERDEVVHPTTDIYMLGKLLWTLVDGRIRLPYQYQNDPKFDLTVTFQGDPHMYFVNKILSTSVVEHEKDCTLTARDMLAYIDKMLQVAERGAQMLRKDVPRPCRMCGEGYYVPVEKLNSVNTLTPGEPISLTVWAGSSGPHQLRVYPYSCSYCGHVEFFTKPEPGESTSKSHY